MKGRTKYVLLIAVLFAWPIFGADVSMKMTTTGGASKVDFQDSTSAEVGSIDSSGKLTVSSHVVTGGYISIPEISSPGTALSSRARLFAKNISGETYLSYVDSSGTERILKPQLNIPIADAETAATNLGTTYKDVHWALDTSKLSRTSVDFGGYSEARVVFPLKNNEADTIQCRIYNETDAAEVASAISDGTASAQLVIGSWTSVSLTGEKIIQAQCREGTGATADPDIGSVRIQIR
jgi:hypothetical protein